MRTIRASEIGTYVYCHRAWWYRKEGYQPDSEKELAAGSKVHLEHTRQVWLSGCIRILAYAFLIAALILIAIHFTREFI